MGNNYPLLTYYYSNCATGEKHECTLWLIWHVTHPISLPHSQDGNRWRQPFIWQSLKTLRCSPSTTTTTAARGSPKEVGPTNNWDWQKCLECREKFDRQIQLWDCWIDLDMSCQRARAPENKNTQRFLTCWSALNIIISDFEERKKERRNECEF